MVLHHVPAVPLQCPEPPLLPDAALALVEPDLVVVAEEVLLQVEPAGERRGVHRADGAGVVGSSIDCSWLRIHDQESSGDSLDSGLGASG